jgi:crotonobetainyl-CoA:carnitine CoA-transferase CaiB-like acyl-CoA transferase
MHQVRELGAIASRLTKTHTPDGRIVNLPPMAVDLEDGVRDLSFAPSYSEHTDAILAEAGLSPDEVAALKNEGVLPG